MLYFSTNRRSPKASFRDAVLAGQPDDRGLYFPESIPRLTPSFLANLRQRSNGEIAFELIKPFVGSSIPENILQAICTEALNFDFPLVRITDRISALELFHGPTMAFKDVGARFMSRCLGYFSRESDERTIVIVATSGDTGGAVAAGFHNVPGIDVVILYPKEKVSKVQELQLTTLGGNVAALEVRGTFDDCQSMAKKALADDDLQSHVHLTSANSINIARWLPQQFYYFYALKQWDGEQPVFSIPSGNFGNLAAGIVAHLSGLPAKKFIAACNANDIVPRFFDTGEYEPKPSVATISNAMDVGDPSNFVRILELFNNKIPDLKCKVKAISISDEITAATMHEVYRSYGYVLDPHGAIGYRALADHLKKHQNDQGIFLETAHPVKFDSVTSILKTAVEMPNAIKELFSREKKSTEIDSNYNDLKDILFSMI
jgi:threonine synthase